VILAPEEPNNWLVNKKCFAPLGQIIPILIVLKIFGLSETINPVYAVEGEK
jgi:hypothetical protein